MELSLDQIRKHVIAALRECLRTEAEFIIDDKTNPIRDLGFDSKDGIDFACALSEKMGWRIPDEINPFVIDDPKRARNVGQIIDLMKELVSR